MNLYEDLGERQAALRVDLADGATAVFPYFSLSVLIYDGVECRAVFGSGDVAVRGTPDEMADGLIEGLRNATIARIRGKTSGHVVVMLRAGEEMVPLVSRRKPAAPSADRKAKSGASAPGV